MCRSCAKPVHGLSKNRGGEYIFVRSSAVHKIVPWGKPALFHRFCTPNYPLLFHVYFSSYNPVAQYVFPTVHMAYKYYNYIYN